jgi:hypothetical protein
MNEDQFLEEYSRLVKVVQIKTDNWKKISLFRTDFGGSYRIREYDVVPNTVSTLILPDNISYSDIFHDIMDGGVFFMYDDVGYIHKKDIKAMSDVDTKINEFLVTWAAHMGWPLPDVSFDKMIEIYLTELALTEVLHDNKDGVGGVDYNFSRLVYGYFWGKYGNSAEANTLTFLLKQQILDRWTMAEKELTKIEEASC